MPIFEEQGEARIVFTRRPDSMPDHQGEVAFPGGKLDETVDRSPRDTALREAREEIGLDPGLVDVVAELDSLGTTGSKFHIAPFVGLVAGGRPDLVPDPREVDHVFDAAVSELLADGVFREEHWELPERGLYAVCLYEVGEDVVWGATARILTRLLADLTKTTIS